jgi:hypothetical protein
VKTIVWYFPLRLINPLLSGLCILYSVIEQHSRNQSNELENNQENSGQTGSLRHISTISNVLEVKKTFLESKRAMGLCGVLKGIIGFFPFFEM